jgi:PAS domain S-box-containing protein
LSSETELFDEKSELGARVARLEQELAAAQAALAAKPIVDRAQLFTLTDALPVLVSVVGRDQRYEFANKAYERWFGPEGGRVTGRHALEVLGQAAYDRLLPYFERVIAGERVTFEADMPYKWGGPRHVHTTFAPRFAPDGSITGVVAMVIDLSSRFVDETALRESEARYRSLFETIDAGFCIIELKFEGDRPVDYRFIEVNPAFERQAGLADAERRWVSELAPDLEAYWFEIYGRVARTGEAVRFENRAAPLGRWFDVHAYRVGEPGQNRVAVLFNDITERKRADEALREETKALETLNRTGAALAAELDHDRIVQLVTDAGVELTGAGFGAFFYNVLNDSGESYMLYTLSGAERSAFENFPMPRATAVFQPTFKGEGIVRSDDIVADPRYGKSGPHFGMPKGHLPVRSYLAVPVNSRTGEVIGGLFFGHAEPGRFAGRHERAIAGLAAQAAVAIDNAHLYRSLQRELDERRRAEAALIESEARFRLIADSAPVPMWVTRLDRKREFVNRAYVDFLGITYEESVDFDWRNVIHPEDLARIHKEQVEKEASLQPFTLEARYRNAQGAWRWLRSESQPRWGANGEHIGFIGVAYDVTIAKEAELALAAEVAERTAERDRMWRLSQDILLIIGLDGVIRAINPAVERYGYDPDTLITRHFTPYVHPDDLAITVEAIARASIEPVAGLETRLRAADGTWRWFSWSIVPGEGAIFAIGRDVSAEKARQAELEAAQEALRQSQKMEAIGQLTGGVAHDFNNLLTPIMGSLDMLRRRMPPDDVRAQRTVDTALQAAERAATLVQRLLAFARRQDLQARAIDIAELLGGMDDLLARSLGSAIRVAVDAPPGLAPARADPNQLELAILNLSINARDAMPGGGTLTITAREEALTAPEADLGPGRYVRIAVADTGIGMDADTVRRAVDPFFSTKGVGKGTGLGLSMVYGFAAQLGGALRLSSAPGVGTTVELWLPVSD